MQSSFANANSPVNPNPVGAPAARANFTPAANVAPAANIAPAANVASDAKVAPAAYAAPVAYVIPGAYVHPPAAPTSLYSAATTTGLVTVERVAAT